MALAGRDLVSIFDFSDREIEGIFDLADEMPLKAPLGPHGAPEGDGSRRGCLTIAGGAILSTLFYEPSTRTRLSFEAAMLRLGGGVISVADTKATSVAKGETIADTVRIIESYADIIVMRHPLEGSARVAADYASVPVVNAGDGSHEHPTQTLLDLYTIRREKGKLRGLSVALVGDLRYGRTAHSLAFGLARFGAKVTFVSPRGLEMPAHLLRRLEKEFDCSPAQYQSLGDVVTDPDSLATLRSSGAAPLRSTSKRRGGDQKALATEVVATFDAVYVTRVQRERFASEPAYQQAKKGYAITDEILSRARPDTVVMHPLPRVDELSYELDHDPRSVYFKQAAYGLPIRMALLAALLGKRVPKVKPSRKGDYRPVPRHEVDFHGITELPCPNQQCVTNHETYLRPHFLFVKHAPDTIACAFCEHEMPSPLKHGEAR
jgi:aspartate carbamoyltransferase catalytic subunit